MNGIPVKLKVGEDDLFDDALMFYKAVAFDPTRPLRVSLLDQPAIDTGDIRRQFFTNVLDEFAFKDLYSMFQSNIPHLRPHYSPQLLPLFKILGTIIVHLILQEGRIVLHDAISKNCSIFSTV